MADAAKEERFDDVKKDAESLASGKTDPAAQPGKLFVPKDFEVEDLMRPFALPSLGGEGFEKRIISLTRKPLPPAQMGRESEELALMAYKAAMIGQIAKTHSPEKEPRAAKDQKEWETLSVDMYDAAMEFAAAAKAKDAKALKTAAVKLNNNCSACHKKFRIMDD
jgi:hypothetical protein